MFIILSLAPTNVNNVFLLAVKITHVTEKEVGEYPNEKTFDQLEDAFGQRERKHSSSNMSNVLEGNKRERKKKRNFLFL
jgi:hypothetical protein